MVEPVPSKPLLTVIGLWLSEAKTPLLSQETSSRAFGLLPHRWGGGLFNVFFYLHYALSFTGIMDSVSLVKYWVVFDTIFSSFSIYQNAIACYYSL